jgi:hypothetical protein
MLADKQPKRWCSFEKLVFFFTQNMADVVLWDAVRENSTIQRSWNLSRSAPDSSPPPDLFHVDKVIRLEVPM